MQLSSVHADIFYNSLFVVMFRESMPTAKREHTIKIYETSSLKLYLKSKKIVYPPNLGGRS